MLRSSRLIRLVALALLLAGGLVNCSNYESPTAPASVATTEALKLPVVSPLLTGLLAADTRVYRHFAALQQGQQTSTGGARRGW